MSILEDIGSVGETPSPSTSLRPRSRLRTTRVSRRYEERMRDAEDDEKQATTDESSPQDPRRSQRRRSHRVKHERLTLRGSSGEENEEEDEDEEEGEEEVEEDDDENSTVDPEDATQDGENGVEDDDEEEEEEEEEEERRSRYSFRERGSVKKPERFDQSMYDEVFQPMRRLVEPPPSRDTRHRTRREEKASRRGSSRRGSKRRRLDDDDDDDDGGVEVDELDYATEESDIEIIQRRIEEQERVEAAEAEAAVAAVQALVDTPRHTRATRYSLRHRDAKDSLSPQRPLANERNGNISSSSRRSHLGENKRRDKRREVEDDDDDVEDTRDEPDNAGRRYSLRRRSNSDLHEQEEEHTPVQSNRSSRRNPTRTETRDRDRERDRRRRAREQSAMERDEAVAAALAADENGPRYSLRDRSKVQRSESVHLKDPSRAAYADFAKRQASRASQRNTGHSFHSSAADRRSNKRSHKRRSDRRRRLSSSSSSSSSDDNFKYYDSDQGGMRTGGGKRRASGPIDRKRADISPIEVDRSITWDSVGGLKKHIEALKEMVMLPLLYPEFYDKFNITPPSGVLFYGPPGTGKTLLARALANSCSIEDESPEVKISLDASEVIDTKKPRNVTFYMRKGADCLSKWVGEAERQLRLLFEEAKRNQPSIIFFDEIDGLAPVRSAKQDQIHASIVSTLLALMDGMDSRGRVVVIGATNRLDAIDPALRRPGRFDRELGFKLPNVVERKKMLEIHSKKWNPPLSEPFLQEIAQRTVGYCGADVKALCAEAALCSLRRVYPQVYGSQDKLLIQLDKIVVSRGDFTEAMKKITPASHRTVSSFASPLPRGVKALLDGSLSGILRKIADQFPLFPLDSQAVDALNKSDGDSSPTRAIVPLDGDDNDENEDDDIYAVMNHDDCDVCHGDEGELLCCDACPGAFHAGCLPDNHGRPNEQSTDWFCPECKDSDKMDALLASKQQKAQQRQARQMYMLPQLVGFPRVLICGTSGMGQEYIAAALLHAMEGLTHFSLDYPSLVADVNTHSAEEALIHRLNEAQKCLPCVIYLPQIDLWWENTPQTMHVALKMMLMNMQIKANLPVLFLATTSSSELKDLSESVLELFTHDRTVQRSSVTWQLNSVSDKKRMAHFSQAFATIGAAPLPRRKRQRGSEKLEILPLAPVAKKSKREPTLAELERIREHDLHCLRELRIFLGQVLDYCAGQRSYSPFHYPVDSEVVPDYNLIIKNPMDLSTMRERLNEGDYTCFEQFLDDIQLIVRNANMFNPKRSATRHIAHAAGTMKDNILSYAHRFRKHQGYDLFAKCREVTKRLHTNPALYNDGPDATQPRRSSSKPTPAKPPLRVSDRLRGIQALESTVGEAPSSRDRDDLVPKSSKKSSGVHANADGEENAAPQWFHAAPSRAMSLTSDPEPVVNVDVDIFGTTDSADVSDANSSLQTQLFEEGETVFVVSRTFPGMNKLGGVGKVVRRNEDGTYFVKYVLGGSEKNVEPIFVRNFTDEAVQESVRNQRNNLSASFPGKGMSSTQKEPTKTNAEIQGEFFDRLVWPILSDEGWTREEVTDVTDDGTSVVIHYIPTPSTDSTAAVALEGVEQVLEFINKDHSLAIKCFGKRFAEELPTKAVFSEDIAEAVTTTESDARESEPINTEGPSSTPTSKQSEAGGTEEAPLLLVAASETNTTKENVEDEEIERPREFIYDEARMTRALSDLVTKTAGWTVGELRDELLLLNKLAYPFRYEHDRSKLMQDVEEHVAGLSR